VVGERDVVQSSSLTADTEAVQVRRGGASDEERLRQLTLLKISQDCLARGYATFAFTSVSEPKPHLPNRAPDAPIEFAATQTFDPASATVPAIEPGTRLTVKFFKQDDPAGADFIAAPLIAANLAPTL